jgi:adenylate cyclase
MTVPERFRRPHGLVGRVAAAVVLILFLLVKLFDPWPLVVLRNTAFDRFQQYAPRLVKDPPVTIIDVDDASLARLGQWPWPRRDLARLVDTLAADGARAVAFDMVFAETDRGDPAGDHAFAVALHQLPTVGGLAFAQSPAGVMTLPPPVAGFAFSGPDPLPHLPGFAAAIMPIQELRAAYAGIGGLNGVAEADGVHRRVPLVFSVAGHLYPSLVLEAVRVFSGDSTYIVKTAGGSGEPSLGTDNGIVSVRVGRSPAPLTIRTDSTGALLLHLGQFPPERVIPAWQVIDGTADRHGIAGQLVLVGTSAAGLVDLRHSALGLRPGVELEAQAISQILDGDYVQRPDWMPGLESALAACAGVLLIVAMPAAAALPGAVLGIAVLIGFAAASWFAFTGWQWLLDPVYPSLSATGVYLAASLGGFVQAERERAFIRRAFSRYLAPSLVNQLAANPKRLRLGGERREMSFVYTDIEAFTTLTERLGPEALAPIINHYFDGASRVITGHGGMVDQFAGDTILAFFNAPLDQADHAARAVACARDLDAFAEEFRCRQTTDGVPFGITRIGVHSGPAVVGNFGSASHLQYSALGDTLNAAARLEGLNKYFGTRVCASAETVARSNDNGVRPLGRVLVKGKSEPIDVYEVLPADRCGASFLDAYRQAYERVRCGDVAAGRRLFARLAQDMPDDGPSRFHLARLEAGDSDVLVVMDDK